MGKGAQKIVVKDYGCFGDGEVKMTTLEGKNSTLSKYKQVYKTMAFH